MKKYEQNERDQQPFYIRHMWILYVPSWIMSIAAIIISLVKLLK